MRKAINKIIRKGMLFAFAYAFCMMLVMLSGNVVYAEDVNDSENTDPEWYKDYEHDIDYEAKTITINKYIGTDTETTVYGKTVIDGVEYATVIGKQKIEFQDPMSMEWKQMDVGIWNDTTIKKLTISSDFMFPNDSSKMFYYNESLEELYFDNVDTGNVTDMREMFAQCINLTKIDLKCFDTSNVTCMSEMFSDCKSLESLDVSDFNTSNVTDMNSMFYWCGKLKYLELSNFDTVNVTNMNRMFMNCAWLQSLDVSSFNTSNVIDMKNMFCCCSGLDSLDLSNFDTGNVISMEEMFDGCSGLESLDLSSFDTSNVTDMCRMFDGCNSLTDIDVSSFNTSNVTNMSGMFYGCNSLTDIDVSSFNTINVVHMSQMFRDCRSLECLDVSGFNTKNVFGISEMFCGCNNIKILDLSNFDLSGLNPAYDNYFNQDVLSGTNLEVLYAPVNIDKGITIGIGSSDEYLVYYDEEDNYYSVLPRELDKSIKLTRLTIKVNSQPDEVKVIKGSKTKFVVDVISGINDEFKYQWYVSSDGGNTWAKSGAVANDTPSYTETSAISHIITLNISTVEIARDKKYKCILKCGKVTVETDPITLTILPAISVQPSSKIVFENDKASFTVKSRSSVATYQWQVSKDNGESWINSGSEGNKTASLAIVAKAGYSGWKFRCKVTNGTWEEYSSAVTLTVKPLVSITTQPKSKSAYYGNTAEFIVKATGKNLKYQWQVSKDGINWAASKAIGYNTTTLSVPATAALNGRYFRCKITGGSKTVYTDVVKLTTKSNITSQPKAKSVNAGGKATFSVKAVGSNLSYQWQVSKDGGKTWANSASAGSKTASITITTKKNYSGWMYRCVVKNGTVKTVSNSAKLTVK
ncbi:surface protein [Eubacterium ruminantium]|nr:surface protein [Eubacterium ruminantium]